MSCVRMPDLNGRLDPIEDRQPEIKEHDVRCESPGKRDRLLAVGGLADDLQLWSGLEDLPGPFTDDGVILCKQDAQDSHRLGTAGRV